MNWFWKKKKPIKVKPLDQGVESLLPVKVVEVKDGDTFRAFITVWIGIIVDVSIRIKGVDTPEKGTRGADKATAFLSDLLNSGKVYVTHAEHGKYAGRALANVIVMRGTEKIDVRQALIINGHAVEYYGGEKNA